MHEIKMREHRNHGAGYIDVRWFCSCEGGVYPFVGTRHVSTVLEKEKY